MKKIDLGFLKNIPLFTDLADDRLEKIKRIIVERSVTAGSVIIKEGTKGTEMFILLDGEVEVSRSLLLKVAGHGMDKGDKSLIRLTGDDFAFFGEMTLFDSNAERSASVTATSDCVLAEIAQRDFFELTESDHEIGYHVLKNLIKIISNRLEKTTKDVLKLTTALSLALDR
jgi:CRP/FNR family transcriptional regulator, cyclic AMP receptor protein